MSTSKKSDDKKTVLIIGAGSGTHIARHIAPHLSPSKHEIILVEPLPYKAIYPATIRMVVTEEGRLEGEDKAFVPLDKVFGTGQPGRVVEGEVVEIVSVGDRAQKKRGEVRLKSGERIEWDILVLGLGSKWSGPIAFPWFEGDAAVREFIKKQRERIRNSKHVVIAGAGAIGIELAGEIKHFYPVKRVTIVQAGSAVLNSAYPDKLKQAVAKRLKERNIDVIYNDYIDNVEDGPVEKIVTRNGKEVQADLFLSARGPKPNTSLLEGTPLSSALTETRYVKIRPTFQVEGFDNVFAVGDIINWDEQKMNAKHRKHAAIAGPNVLSVLNNTGGKLKEYKGVMEMILITMGKNGGVAFMNFGWFSIVLGDWITRMIKSKGLLLRMLRPDFGQK